MSRARTSRQRKGGARRKRRVQPPCFTGYGVIHVDAGEAVGVAVGLRSGEMTPVAELGMILETGGVFEVHITVVPAGGPVEGPAVH